jgi:segregation and condensation protein B
VPGAGAGVGAAPEVAVPGARAGAAPEAGAPGAGAGVDDAELEVAVPGAELEVGGGPEVAVPGAELEVGGEPEVAVPGAGAGVGGEPGTAGVLDGPGAGTVRDDEPVGTTHAGIAPADVEAAGPWSADEPANHMGEAAPRAAGAGSAQAGPGRTVYEVVGDGAMPEGDAEPAQTGEQVEAGTESQDGSPGPLALVGEAELRGALEAILLVVEEPVGEIMLAQVLEQPTERITTLLTTLAGEYEADGRGFELRKAAGGWRLYTRPEYAPYVERFVLDGQQVRLTQAALETLAVVAYKQPVTRSRISAIRGVNCDGVIRTLVSRGLVEECGTESDSGAYLYRTTVMFLEKLGLNSVDELPPLAPFLPDDVEELADAT